MVIGAKTFHLTISSVGEPLFDDMAASVTLPGTAGEMTILPAHEPLVTTLAKGVITVRREGGETQQYEIERGVLECSDSRVIVLL